MKISLNYLTAILILGLGGSAPAAVTGQWDFNSGDLSATIGTGLGDFGGTTLAATTFGTATIGGSSAYVMNFPAATPTQGYIMTHSMTPNGGSATYVNQWTLIMDVLLPAATDGTYRALLQSNEGNANDADLWVRPDNSIGFGAGGYHGTLTLGVWHRLAFVVDASSPTSANNSIRKFVDGTLIGISSPIQQDGAFGLDPTALLFTDNDNETSYGSVNSIQIHDTVLSDSDIAGLGGATAAGIAVVPEPASGLLLGLGLLLVAGRGFRRN